MKGDFRAQCTGIKRRDPACLIIMAIGLVFGLWYIKNSCCDVAYSDYIRLVESYLPDVTDPDKFFVPDILTRVPAAFFARAVNVKLFGFSVTFDRLLTLSGFFLCSLILFIYVRGKNLGALAYAILIFLLYSLNKWEIFINGSAWAHVVSFGLFFSYYYMFEAFALKGERKLFVPLCLMPFLILLFAGEYIASYSAVMLLFSALFFIFPGNGRVDLKEAGLKPEEQKEAEHSRGDLKSGAPERSDKRRAMAFVFLSVLVTLSLYLISRSFAVWEHAGSTELGFFDFIKTDPMFIPRFFVKSFAGTVMGGETISSLSQYLSSGSLDLFTLILGAAVILSYILAIFLFFSERMYEETVFPMILLLSGGFNHVLVTAGRWIFEDEGYALSSRYGAQFVIGILGVFLIYFLYLKKREAKGFIKGSLIILIILFLAGNCYTCYQEIGKMPYREANYERMAEAVRNYENYSDDELCEILEWHKDPRILKDAIEILKENRLNVFRGQ